MKLRTTVNIKTDPGFIRHDNSVMGIGSCFANHIGDLLNMRQIDTVVNPFGILFNPLSMAIAIRQALAGEIDQNLILSTRGRFFHYHYHSSCSGDTREDLLAGIRKNQENFKRTLEKTDRLVLTFGTAWVYRLIAYDAVVANCHKIPQREFQKEMLGLEEIRQSIYSLLEELKGHYPQLEIVLTVSPVRHIKNGMHENNLSKSVLLLMCNYLAEKLDYVRYFPAYELVMDELRDYRFFKEDMIHPTDQAVRYVFDRFAEAYFNDQTNQIAALNMRIQQLTNHRPLQTNSADSHKAVQKLKRLKAELEELKRKG